MSSKTTENFLEMVQLKFEFTAQELSDPSRMYQSTGLKFSTGYDHERYLQFRSVIRRVCDKILSSEIELDENLTLEGLVPRADPPLMVFEIPPGTQAVKLLRSELDIYPLAITDSDEMQALAYILTVWQNAWMQAVDPQEAVRARLHEMGIHSWQDFEDHKAEFMIHNPFPQPS